MKKLKLTLEEVSRARDLSHARQIAALRLESAQIAAQLVDAQSQLLFARHGIDPVTVGEVVLAEGPDFGLVRDRNGQPINIPGDEPAEKVAEDPQ